jgi:long-chain acyl-CoA synthetase
VGKEFIAKYTDLVGLVEDAFAAQPKSNLFGVEEGGSFRWLRYSEVAERAGRFERLLVKYVIEPNDKVAIIAANRPEWLAVALAAHRLGAVVVPLYEAQKESEWEYILRDCDAKAVITANDAIATKIRAMKPRLAKLESVGTFDDDAGAGGDGEEPARVVPEKDDLAFIIYTSGTTGNPKGVELTHGGLSFVVCSLHEAIPFEKGTRMVSILPWAHVGGVVELYVCVHAGSALAIAAGVDRIVPTIQHTRPTRLVGVPRVWCKLYDGIHKKMAAAPAPVRTLFQSGMRAAIADREGRDIGMTDRLALSLAQRYVFPKVRDGLGGELKMAISGAAALSVDIAKFIDALGIQLLDVYGQTELSALATANRPGATRLGTVGQPLPGVKIKIDGHGEGGGEILVKTPGAMRGYHKLPDETRAVMTDDGWIRTGDLGRLDPEDYLTITGRVREVYKLENGKFVSPAPIEEKLATSPYITQAMIFGLNKPYNVALLVVDCAAICAWCKESGVGDLDAEKAVAHEKVKLLLAGEVQRLSGAFKAYERVERFHVVTEELTLANDMLTPSMKVKRRKVLERWGKDLERLYG